MAKRIHTEADGITQRTRPTYTFEGMDAAEAADLMADLAATERANAWTAIAADLDAACRAVLTASDETAAPYGAPAWYAATILARLDDARDVLSRLSERANLSRDAQGLVNLLAAQAFTIGRLHASEATGPLDRWQ
jgi:hypothetical protein